ncbi:histone-lysine N-methyltransferase, H3 lysine-79 specific-like [Sinocyclocheilus rhinocerous]|uniref:histone-lysine N-methyltransferase, H3 lysine-79 specific-like n=1 Tax=Sinocyclocheilus rhinocerous TaxID=307959 RepID=UPI0007B8CBE2|nr:PREDICTED: histone-lysine N-methyltransferase, H3 lysine-79 specific-like [Sinocyclocheilus rhinocerous]
MRYVSVSVIDTPGLFDTELTNEEIQREIRHCISMILPGPHVFIIVLNLGQRFTQEEATSLKIIQETFGDKSLMFTVVLFTRGDDLKDKTIEQFLGKPGSPLMKLIEACGNRYHVFSNNQTADRTQVTDLLQKIDDMVKENGGSFYSCKMFREMEREKQEQQMKILMDRVREREEEMKKHEEEKERVKMMMEEERQNQDKERKRRGEEEFNEREERYKREMREMKEEREEWEKQKLEEKTRREEEDEKIREKDKQIQRLQSEMEGIVREKERIVRERREQLEDSENRLKEERKMREDQQKTLEEKLRLQIICEKLKEPIEQSVYKKTARDLADDMRSNCESLNGNRSNLEKHILKTLAEEEDFNKYMNYIHNARDHFSGFIRDEVSRYITDQFSVSVLHKMKMNIRFMEQKIMRAARESTEHVQVNRGDAGLWLKSFTQQLSDELIFSEKHLTGVNHDDVDDFKLLEEVMRQELPAIMSDISCRFNTETFPVNLDYKFRPDELLIDHFCQCCWVQCPFSAEFLGFIISDNKVYLS